MKTRAEIIDAWAGDLKAYLEPKTQLRALAKALRRYDQDSGRACVQDRSYYAYVLLDPTITTRLKSYKGLSGLSFKSVHPPFYVGKGRGNRVLAHMKERYRKGSIRSSTIRKILSEYKCYEYLIFENLDQHEAFAYELDLIKGLGRLDLGRGPLTNLCDGGLGALNHKTSDAVRTFRSLRMKNAYLARTHKEQEAYARLIKEGLSRMSPSSVEKKIQAGITSTSKVYDCPHCGLSGRGPNMLSYHMDKCLSNPKLSKKDRETRSLRNQAASEARNAAMRAAPRITCTSCGKEGQDIGHFRRFHFDKCIYK